MSANLAAASPFLTSVLSVRECLISRPSFVFIVNVFRETLIESARAYIGIGLFAAFLSAAVAGFSFAFFAVAAGAASAFFFSCANSGLESDQPNAATIVRVRIFMGGTDRWDGGFLAVHASWKSAPPASRAF